MAPAAQKKGKKTSAAKKDSPAQKKQQQQQSQLQQEEQEEVLMKEAGEPKSDEVVAPPEASEAPPSATDAAGKDAVAEAAATEEDTPAVEPDASKAEGHDAEEEVKADQDEAAVEDMEGDDAGDVDEEVEEVEEVEEAEEEDEEADGVENGSGDKVAEEDAAMEHGDEGGDGNLEGEGSDGEDNAAGDGTSKGMPDDNFGPSGGKIFIGGLSRETTTEVLTRHFEKYGELTDSVIMKNRSTGQPRGFGFVTYADPSIVDRVLQDTHIIDGRTVDAKRTVPRERMSVPTKGPKTKKVFVGGLTSSTTEDDLKDYFGKFGKITSCQIMQDHKIGKSRGFGFVTFDTEQVVEEILAQGKMHEIDGKQVEIKKAEPKRASDPPPVHDRSGYMGGRRTAAGAGVSAYGANTGFYGGFHAADAPMYGGAGGYFNRGAGRPGGLAYGDNYGYGGGYGAPYGYGEFDEGYGSMNYNPAGYGSGSGYGGYNYGGGGGYGSSSRGYGSGRYHPYSR